jgi:hypothetical protein
MKITYIFSFLLAIVMLSTTACSKKTSGKMAEDKAVSESEDKLAGMSDETAERMKADTLLLFQKTACFGACPTYDVLVYSNGKVMYKGIKNVDRMGVHHSKLDIKQLSELLKEASKCNFFNLADNYPVDDAEFIADLSNTIVYLKQGDLRKKIFDNNGAPEELVAFEQYLVTLFESLEYSAPVNK